MTETSGYTGVTPPDVYRQAFDKVRTELIALRRRAFDLKRQLAQIDGEIEEKFNAAKSLADLVARQGNPELKTELRAIQRGSLPSSRTSFAYDALRKLLERRIDKGAELTTTQVMSDIKSSEIGIDAKSVYNALNYLEKTGKLRRVSRGHYRVTDGGYGVLSSHEINHLEDRDLSD
jgi:hypothetical protein